MFLSIYCLMFLSIPLLGPYSFYGRFVFAFAKFAVPISECTFDVHLTLHYVGTIPISFEETQVFLYIFLFDSPSSVQYTYVPI